MQSQLVSYDDIINRDGKKIFQSQHNQLVPRRFAEEDLVRPDEDEIAKTTTRTQKALQQMTESRIAAAQPGAGLSKPKAPTYIRYTPVQTSVKSSASTKIIRMTDVVQDPLEPPKFKSKKIPRGPGSPPVPVMHSPPKKLTAEDQQAWKIPPCISNWKNNKGYTIPLDKRLAADGRGLIDLQINDNFAKFSESLYIAERTAREEVSKRAEVEKLLKLKEKEKKEQNLRELAQRAREERMTSQLAPVEDDEEEAQRRERDSMRDERRREREREIRLNKKSAALRNEDRDISEKIALGMAVPQQSAETMFDQRLFNQSSGMTQGYEDDEGYNIYSKPLFVGGSENFIYRPKKNADDDVYGGQEALKEVTETAKFRPDKDFSGVDRTHKAQPRDKPVEFEKEEDPFGLDQFLHEAKTSKPLDKVGSSGHMSLASGSSEPSKRGRVEFDDKATKKRK